MQFLGVADRVLEGPAPSMKMIIRPAEIPSNGDGKCHIIVDQNMKD